MSDIASQSQGQSAPADFVALAAGQTIGRYEIVSILGQGGFGITYRARDAQLGREVAIKEYLPLALAVRQGGTTVLPRSTDAAEDFGWGRDRFVAEGRTLATLQRAPAIVRVYDFLEANGTAYIVMELLHGQTLERRLKEGGPLSPAEVDRMLWPLLDGLEQVHGAGFLHRDIKPANILLDGQGNPTLIDFGASRAAVAGRTAAMTAIFTPGYAAAEQMTSAKQGPWTDIYGLAATFYHAITGTPPASAFDRMLDDEHQRLATKAPAGFASGLLAGLDAGLALRAGDRPQSIAGWRPILGHAGSLQGDATVVMGRPSAATVAMPPPRPKRRGAALWIGAAAAAVVALGGGYFALVDDRRAGSAAAEKAAQEAQVAQEAQRQRDQTELARLREQVAVREKAEQDAAQRRQIEEETRQKVAAEMAEQKRLDDEARQKVEADAAAQRKAEEDGRKAAEAAEAVLRLTPLDRQHVQIALTALGYATNGSDGTFGVRTREMVAAWQKARNDLPTGFLSGAQNQSLLKEAAPAILRFDEEQKKLDDARKKADEDKTRAESAARAASAPAAAAPRADAPRADAPDAAAAVPRSGPDGVWQGGMHCTPARNGGEFSLRLAMTVAGGSGTWFRPGTGEGGIQSISLTFNGNQVAVSRIYEPANRAGTKQTATMRAQYDGRDTVTGSGPEANGGGRICDISVKRVR